MISASLEAHVPDQQYGPTYGPCSGFAIGAQLQVEFPSDGPAQYPGTTSLGASAAVLDGLKTRGETRLAYKPADVWTRTIQL